MRPPARRVLPLLLVSCCLASSCSKKKKEPTYADNLAGAMREAKASEAQGHMKSVAVAVTQWVSNDGNLSDVPDYAALTAALAPTWLRVMPAADPWGTPYVWGTDGNSWELRSWGRNQKPGDADDMVMRDGQITQMPKSFNPVQATH